MTCRLIVCEKTNRWATAMRAALGLSQRQVLETRSLAGCESALAEAPASLAAVEVTAANLEQVIDFVVQTGRRFPRALIVALLSEEAASAEWLLRETGVIDAVGSVLDAPRVARLARRHFAACPPAEVNLQELVSQRMPWAAHT